MSNYHKWKKKELIRELEKLRQDINLSGLVSNKSESEYLHLFNVLNEPVFISDLKGNILDMNDKASEQLGYSRSEIKKLGLKGILTPERGKKASGQIKKLVDRGSLVWLTEHRAKNGNVIYAELSACIFDYKGQQAILGIARDVTKQIKLTEALKESELHYHNIVENAQGGILVIDDKFRLIYTNPAFSKMVGYEREDLDNLDFRTLLGAKSFDKVSAYYQKRQHGEKLPSVYELELMRKDGQIRAAELHSSIQKTSTGKVQTHVQIIDITEFVDARRKMEEKTERLEKAQKIGRMGFLDGNIETNKIVLSSEVYKMFGLPMKEYTTQELINLVVYPPDLKKVSRNLELALQKKKPFNMEHRVCRPDGTIIWVHVRVELSVDKETGKHRLLGTVLDITPQKKAAQKVKEYSKQLEKKVRERTHELELINRKLEESNRELDSFAYSVSHDLKAPLRAINGFSRELQILIWDRLDEEEREYLSIVLESSVKMGHLVDDLLKLSRSGRKKPAMRKVAVRPLVKDVLKDVQKNYGGRKVNVSMGRLYTVQADASLLLEVFYNLLDNAFKYTGTTEHAEVSISSSLKGDEVVFSISDNGVGFDMKYKDKLFLVFQRLHSDPVFAGTGIGLALVKQIVSRHGGRVWAEGEVDKGARFFITLPRNQ